MILKRYLLVVTALAAIWYLSGSFIAGSFNPAMWDGFCKALIVVLWMFKSFVIYQYNRRSINNEIFGTNR